jgi:NAD(P)-dependent dehydrogenase (short-subunit alcohol dehydrogenase family)
VNRLADPDELAQAAVWLLSDRASFTTGSAMCVDGGYTMSAYDLTCSAAYGLTCRGPGVS